jgi:hypothetical protein
MNSSRTTTKKVLFDLGRVGQVKDQLWPLVSALTCQLCRLPHLRQNHQVKSLALLIPCYNESRTLPKIFEELAALETGLFSEVIFVDDGSTDSSASLIQNFINDSTIIATLIQLGRNQGKGSAIHEGVLVAQSSHLLILDADMELLPSEIPTMWEQVKNGRSEVIFGVRKFSSQSSFTYRFVIGNRIISNFFGLLFNAYLQDVMCGFKLLPTPLWKTINLAQHGFAIEVEIPVRCLERGIKPWEVPVSYYPRTREQGKGITVVDGFFILFKLVILRARFKHV